MKKLSLTTLTVLGFLIAGCSGRIKPVKLAEGMNASQGISAQQLLMEQARADQVDVLASGSFETAGIFLLKAKKENSEKVPTEDVLETIAYSKAYLELAVREAFTANLRVEEISKARQQAIKAGARHFSDQLNVLDADFKDVSSRPNKLSADKKACLQSNYLALEVQSMKKFKKLR